MKLLVDSCVWGGAQIELRVAGQEVQSAADWPADPGDEALFADAIREQQVVVTLDKDFETLAVVQDLTHFGIVRLVGISAQLQGSVP